MHLRVSHSSSSRVIPRQLLSKVPILYSMNTLKFDYASDMISVRDRSNLKGPLKQQNELSAYKLNPLASDYTYHGLATENGVLVGYVLSKLFETKKLYFGWSSYKKPFGLSSLVDPKLPALTLMIHEICVCESSQGLGIASQLLDYLLLYTKGVIKKKNINARLENVEFSILASNISSEILFTKFGEKWGTSVTLGSFAPTTWGTYIDWKLKLSHDEDPAQQTRLLFISNEEGFKGSSDKRSLLERSRKRQTSRFG